MKQQLSLSMRPKSFDEFFGQEEVFEKLKKHLLKSGRQSNAFLIKGESGAGKTSLAEVMALSYQCTHSEFGSPCIKCRKRRSSFNIQKVNAASITGKEEIEQVLSTAYDLPSMGSKKRIFIFNEVQRTSKNAQDSMLETMENTPASTIYLLTTTEPSAVARAMRRRCFPIKMQPLDEKGVRTMTSEVLKRLNLKEKLSALKLSEALTDNGITSPGFVMIALEKYIAGESAEEAAQVDLESGFNHNALTKCIIKGDWSGAAEELKKATVDDARSVQQGVASYLRTILLESPEIDDNNKVLSRAILELAGFGNISSNILLSAISANVYNLCKHFSSHPR